VKRRRQKRERNFSKPFVRSLLTDLFVELKLRELRKRRRARFR